MNTYGNTGTNGDDDQSHDVGIDIKDASCSADQCHHAEAEHGDPEDGHEEAHQVVLPVFEEKIYNNLYKTIIINGQRQKLTR